MFPDDFDENQTTRRDDLYVLAKLALWAGDIDQALYWLHSLLSERRYSLHRYPPHAEVDVIGTAAFRLCRQAVRLRSEVRRAGRATGRDLLFTQPRILSDEDWYVRASVWRREPRRFSSLIYLCDLQMETDFYRVIESIADPREKNTSAPRYDRPAAKRISADILSSETLTAEYAPVLTFEGNPFIEAWVSDFGTIEAEAIWINRHLPDGEEPIIESLKAILSKFRRPIA